jgi:hypothetical protein
MVLLSRVKLFISRLQYRLDNFFLKGVPAQFTVLFVLMFGVILLGTLGLPLGLYSESNKDIAAIGHKMGEGFWDALWWSTMHIFDPSYVSQDYGATAPVVILAMVIGLLGLVLFGGMIGLVSAAVDRKLESLTKGDRPVRESGHLLILGWNEKIFSILDLFEDYNRDVVVVILANHPVTEMHDLLRTERAKIRRVKPILRTGSPNNLSELERVAFRTAYSIIVLADDSVGKDSEEADIRTIKTMMLLAGNLPTVPPRPKMVAEIVHRENMDVARIAGRCGISLICSGEVLSRMIVQSSRQPGLAYIYNELFGFAGSEIYVQLHPGACGRCFGDVLFEFPNAIPIGTSGMETRDGKPFFVQQMNPGKDYIIGDSEWLILVAADAEVAHRPNTAPARETEFIVPEPRRFAREKILILGWNSNLFSILREYDSFLQEGSEITIAALHPAEVALGLLAEQITEPLQNSTHRYVQVDYATQSKLEPLLASGHSTCLVLADESSGERDPDSRVIVTVLLIQDYVAQHPERKFNQVVSEVISAANSDLLRQNCQTDVVVSPRLAAMMIAQMSQQLMLERVYADLMNANANEVYLKPGARYTRHPERCTFSDLMRGALQLGELAIGVKYAVDAKNAERNFGVRLNPPKEENLMLGEGDEVVVISVSGTRAKAR